MQYIRASNDTLALQIENTKHSNAKIINKEIIKANNKIDMLHE